MRLIFFNYEYPPLGGGAGNAAACLLKEYSKISDLEVDFVTSGISNKYELEKIGKNVRVHKLPIGKNSKNLHFQSQKDLLIYAWKAFWFSKKLFKEKKYDLTHSFFTVPCGFLSLVFYCQKKVPFIVSLRGADVPGYAQRFNLIYKILSPLIGFIWKKADYVVSNSEGLKELALKANSGQKIEVIYNGINTEEFKPGTGDKEDKKFIITPGASRVTERKGIRYLIEAVNILSKDYPGVILQIIGDGNEKENLKNLSASLGISDKVIFLGRMEHEKTAVYYQKSDVFVLPSFNEGMSNSMLEALSSGLPILATDTGGSKELIDEGENGYIIKMRDSVDIAEKIRRLVLDRELRKKMGEKSRQKALRMSWEIVAKDYHKLYVGVVKKTYDKKIFKNCFKSDC